jgi:phospholipid/cholesterol/gamma-HCH transport system substrate-binding protein
MRNRDVTAGVFIVAGMILFSVGIFLIGSQRKTFSRNFEVYTQFADLNGLMKGTKVQVAGSGAGEVTEIVVPQSPDAPFRIRPFPPPLCECATTRIVVISPVS